ncbi:hypothetical protein H5410_016913 [Solanum commersonii]|uniref:Uncharacterized protein n=1 Tax=Solanum commersonii TaxID=4109 RepID=A0A9J5ZXU2_SOLCO|nr:hypothetical protein H5410_016913 [Solanum commersonii]
MSALRWVDLIDEEEKVSPLSVNSKLGPKTSIFVLVFFDEGEKDNMLDIYFYKVARDVNMLSKHQRSGNNKVKKRTH